MSHDDGGACRPDITDRGYPTRTALVLRREENLFRAEAEELVSGGGEPGAATVDGEPTEGDEPTISLGRVEEVLKAGDPTLAPQAAFLAGRCAYPDDATRDRLAVGLRALLAGPGDTDLGSRALAHVEAAMSLALAGHKEARSILSDVVSAAPSSMADWLAAAYLAELGDPMGWPVLVGLLTGDDGFTRLMAARHIAMWLPYDGQEVGGVPVDVRGRLLERAEDTDSLVADEIPALLAEVGGPDLADDLARLAKKARHKSTRAAAKSVIERTPR